MEGTVTAKTEAEVRLSCSKNSREWLDERSKLERILETRDEVLRQGKEQIVWGFVGHWMG